MEIFSKAAKGVDMVGFAEKMATANPLIAEQEKAIKAAADTYDLLAQTSRDVMLVLATELGPILKDTVGYFKTLSDNGVSLSAIFKTVFQTVAVLGSEIAYFFKAIFDEIGFAYTNAVVLVTKGVDAAIEANRKYNNSVLAQKIQLDLFQSKVMGEPQYGNSIDALVASGGPKPKAPSGGRNVTDAAEKERKRLAEAASKEAKRLAEAQEREQARLLEKYRNEIKEQANNATRAEYLEVTAYQNAIATIRAKEQSLKIQNDIFAIEQANQNLRSDDVKLIKDLYLNEQQRLENIKEIQKNNILDSDAKAHLISQENALADATERYLRAQNQAVQAQREGAFGEGFMKEGSRFFRDMPTDLENGAKAFQSVMGNMESALDNFVRTGKLSFKSLARSIIQDLIAVQLKASASSIFRTLLGGFGFMNDRGGMELSGSLGFADGGSPPVGKASIVGERGPELFVPRSAGTIIPNHALGGMGGTTNVTNNYINAIDTKSFEERLYGSSNAIWAANQYANKSLAVNRGRA
jgi:lambda family phage tail tape measure protein